MSTLVVANCGELVTNDPGIDKGPLGTVRDVDVTILDGIVASISPAGSDEGLDRAVPTVEVLDAAGRAVIPGFVDSHTHLVFAGDRVAEFTARMAGSPYEAGGIAATVAATRAASDAHLMAGARRLATEALRSGTTTLETKSGYGLTTFDERRSLEVAGGVAGEVTFLGAHVIPVEYRDRADDYVALVAGEMLDACAPLARWCDVFCERGAFDADQARAVLEAGARHGLGLRMHANQLGPGPGVQLAVELGAASVDHCTHVGDDDVEALASGRTVATLLPGAEFSTCSAYPDARRLLGAGVQIALASDCNPGTSYTTNMAFVIALAVREMGLTPAEALVAATSGGAAALSRDDVGRLAPGSRGDLVVLAAPTYAHLAYRPGVDLVDAVVAGGRVVRSTRTG